MNFFEELKRRNVFRVGIAYAVGAWLLLQFTDVLSELLKLPDQVGPVVVALVAVGFPVALFFAWAFELTPDGIKRESEVQPDSSIMRQTGRKLDRAIIVMLVVVACYFIWESRFANRTPPVAPATSVDIPDGNAEAQATDSLAAGVEPDSGPVEAPAINPRSIAVLPFDNRSRLEDDEFFVEGIHDDLLTNLARIGDLKVISRTSVLRYQDTTQPIPEIAKELGVATVMEGAVQRSGNTVRVNVQLIDAETDEHLWAEIFDRELTADNLFAIQTEISERIADALKTTLTPEEQERISERPTDNLAAYSAYLRGRRLLNERNSESIDRALAELENAVLEDPGFALAWATLAEARWQSSNYSDGPPKEYIEQARAATDRALSLDPDLGLAWSWRGVFLMFLDEQLAAAEAAYRKSVELAPNNITVLRHWADFLAYYLHRPLDALVPVDRAIELDPYSSLLRQSRADLLSYARRFAPAAEELEVLLRMDPDFARAHMNLANLYWSDMFRFEDALEHARQAIALDPGNPSYLLNYYVLLRNLGAVDQANEVKLQLQEQWPDHWASVWIDLVTQAGEGQFDAGVETVQTIESMFGFRPSMWGAYVAALHAAKGDFGKAYAVLEEREPRAFQPDTWETWLPSTYPFACGMAMILMRGGSPEIGRDLAERTLNLILENSLQGGDPHIRYLEDCYVALGQVDLALVAMQQRYEHDHIDGWWSARNGTTSAELRENARFIEIIDGVEARMIEERDRLIAKGVL
jgi:TolB-like protein/Tfp pilus assembly protein PilF